MPMKPDQKNAQEDSATKQFATPSRDGDANKGAVENDDPKSAANTSMRGQLGHRDQDSMIKGNDTDYPEPGENAEHSGEKE